MAQRLTPLTTTADILRSRAFWITLLINTLWAGLLASQPLTGILGFEFCLLFGFVTTVTLSHFTLATWRRRAQSKEGMGLVGGLIRLWAVSLCLVAPGLGLICANALRITNCNFATGFAFFAALPLAGTFFGIAMGTLLATFQRQRLATAMVYLIPLAGIVYALLHGLLHPPIFAYDPYFGFFPGSLYDELREVTQTLVLYRISTLALAGCLVGLVGLLAGRHGVIGQRLFGWREASLQRSPEALDGRLRWGASKELALGTCGWTLLCLALLLGLYSMRHDLGTTHTNASIQAGLGGRYESPHFIIYYDRNALSPKRLARIVRDHEFRYQQLVRFFGHRPARKIESYLFKSSAQKAFYMGAARTMIARPWAYQFYLHGYSFPHGVLKHEMAHVFSAQFGVGPLRLSARYGVLMNTALIEGVAVAADWVRDELTPHAWSRAMLDLGKAPDPVKLLGPTGFFQQAAWSAYTVAGSLSRYLITTYGIGRYKRVYGQGDFQGVYGKSLRQLTQEWHHFLRTKIKLSARAKRLAAYRFRRYRSIFVRVCPHEIASLREQVSTHQRMRAYPKAIALQSAICRRSPRGYNKLGLLNLHFAAKHDRRAQAMAAQLLREYPAKEAPVLHAQLRTVAGRLAYRRGDMVASRQHFAQAAKQHIYLSYQRTLLVYLYALRHPSLSKVMMDYLHGDHQVSALLALQRAYLQHKDAPMLAYLLARRFFSDTQYKQALALFSVAARLKALPLRAEITRLQALAHFYLGEYTRAAEYFGLLSQLPLPSGLRKQAEDWRARAIWEKQTYGRPPGSRKKP